MSACYLLPEVLDKLQIAETTFLELRRKGKLPMVEEIQPRIGRRARYRADLIDRYLEGRFYESRHFGAHRAAR